MKRQKYDIMLLLFVIHNLNHWIERVNGTDVINPKKKKIYSFNLLWLLLSLSLAFYAAYFLYLLCINSA